MDTHTWIMLVVLAIIGKIIFWVCICYRISSRRNETVIVERNISVQSDQIQGPPGELLQMPSGEIVRVPVAPNANMQPPHYHPGQAQGRLVDMDPSVGISQKVGLVDQA